MITGGGGGNKVTVIIEASGLGISSDSATMEEPHPTVASLISIHLLCRSQLIQRTLFDLTLPFVDGC